MDVNYSNMLKSKQYAESMTTNYKEAAQQVRNFISDVKKREQQLQNEQDVTKTTTTPPVRSQNSSYQSSEIECGTENNSVECKISHDARQPPIDEQKKMADELKVQGNNYVKLKQYDNAIQCYTNAIDLDKNEPIYYANRALCHLKMENYEKCIEDCNETIDIDKNYVKAYFRRMQAFEGLGNYDDAFKNCRQVLQIEPMNVEANSALQRLKKRYNFMECHQELAGVKPFKKIDSTIQIQLLNERDQQLKSKFVKPLREMNIKEIYDPSKSDDEDENLSRQTEIKSKIIEDKDNSDVKIIVKKLLPPKSSTEFNITWRSLNMEQKYSYLKLIDPLKLNTYLGPVLESKTVSDIISILFNYFMKNEENVGEILYNFSKHENMKILALFLDQQEKDNCLQLIEYMKKKNDNLQYIEKIKNNFSLH